MPSQGFMTRPSQGEFSISVRGSSPLSCRGRTIDEDFVVSIRSTSQSTSILGVGRGKVRLARDLSRTQYKAKTAIGLLWRIDDYYPPRQRP